MSNSRLTLIHKTRYYEFDLAYTTSLAHLINSIRQQIRELPYSFSLVQSITGAHQLDSAAFDKLRQNDKPFTLYVMDSKAEQDEVQQQLGRLKMNQDAARSEEIQVSFNQNSLSSDRQPSYSHLQQQSQSTLPKIIEEKQINHQVTRQKYIQPKQQQPSMQQQQYPYIQQNTQESSMALGIQCDICFAFPINGCIFKCLVCQNFDLCQQCQRHYHQFHPVLVINKKQQYPTEIDITFSQEAGKYMNEKLGEERATLRQIKKVFYQKDGENSREREVDSRLLASKKVRASNFLSCLLNSN